MGDRVIAETLRGLATRAEACARRVSVHASLVRDSQRGLRVHASVKVSRDAALAVLAELFQEIYRLPDAGARLPVAAVADSIQRRVDAFAVGSLDVGMVDAMGELLDACAKQLRAAAEVAEREESRYVTDTAAQ